MNDMISQYAEIAPAFLAFLKKKEEALEKTIQKLKQQDDSEQVDDDGRVAEEATAEE